MKKLLALSTLVGATGLMVFGTTSCQKVKMGEEDNEKVVLTSGGNESSTASSATLDRISEEFKNYVRPGDIWYDSLGQQIMNSYTGHVGIVEKVEKGSNGRYCLKVIEANPEADSYHGAGVARGTVSPERFYNQKSTVLRVKTVSDTQRKRAVNFCISQIGCSYPGQLVWPLPIPDVTAKKNPSDIKQGYTYTWYCSELVRAAYMQFNIDLEHPYLVINHPEYNPMVMTTKGLGAMYVFGAYLADPIGFGVNAGLNPRDIVETFTNVSPHEIADSGYCIDIVQYDKKVSVKAYSDSHRYMFEGNSGANFENHEYESGKTRCRVCGWPKGCGA